MASREKRLHAYRHNASLGDCGIVKSFLFKLGSAPTLTPKAKVLVSQLQEILQELHEEVYMHRLEPDNTIAVINHDWPQNQKDR